MIKAGLGVTVLPKLVFKGAVNGIRVIELKPEISRTVGFTHNKQRIQELGLTKFYKIFGA